MDRAPDYGSGGYRFKSCRAHHLSPSITRRLWFVAELGLEGSRARNHPRNHPLLPWLACEYRYGAPPMMNDVANAMWTWLWSWPWLWLSAWACAWAEGLLFAIGVGHFCVKYPLDYLREKMGVNKPSRRAPIPTFNKQPSVPPPLTGSVERLFFTVLVGSSVDGYPTAMMAWLALKLASNWNHKDMEGKPGARALALTALLAGIVSMLFAVWGGFIVRKSLPAPIP